MIIFVFKGLYKQPILSILKQINQRKIFAFRKNSLLSFKMRNGNAVTRIGERYYTMIMVSVERNGFGWQQRYFKLYLLTEQCPEILIFLEGFSRNFNQMFVLEEAAI